ncbi:DUF6128 domain-containing protein [Novisyntrophococcus fermenticellae]|uniref:DUF6128 domain-containing protein n=1 Tax=Novisyntrophococcus fermenticellae TaxID=2068655 RepID=UPI001E3DFD1C|nr:DUF6128 domain-containing protein [Novisyntrophococcus fermenticellae]
MSNYKRFVSYLYEYVADKKTDNRGFVRIELRSGTCRMQFQLKVFSLPEHTPVLVYGCTYSDGRLTGYPLGRIHAGKDGISGSLTISERIPGTTYTILEFNGLLLTEPQGKFYCSQWDDNPIIPSQFQPLPDSTEEQPSETSDNHSEETPSPQVKTGKATGSRGEAASKKTALQMESASEVPSPQMEIAPEEAALQMASASEPSSPQMEIAPKEAAPQMASASEVPSPQMETAPKEAALQMASASGPSSPQMETAPEETAPQMAPASESSSEASHSDDDAYTKEQTSGEYDYRGKNGAVQAADSLVMDKTVSNEWAEIKKNYPPCSPFYDDEIEDCVRISIRDFPELRKYGFPLGCNQFIHHGYQNYNHLLLGRMNSSKSCEYVLGVPGVYNSNEQFMASMHGFNYFKPARIKEAPRSGRTGYWLRPIK